MNKKNGLFFTVFFFVCASCVTLLADSKNTQTAFSAETFYTLAGLWNEAKYKDYQALLLLCLQTKPDIKHKKLLEALNFSEALFYLNFAQNKPALKLPDSPELDTVLAVFFKTFHPDKDADELRIAFKLFTFLKNSPLLPPEISLAEFIKSENTNFTPVLPSETEKKVLLLHSFSRLALFDAGGGPRLENLAAFLDDPLTFFLLFDQKNYSALQEKVLKSIDNYASAFNNSAFDDIGTNARALYDCRTLVLKTEKISCRYGIPLKIILSEALMRQYNFIKTQAVYAAFTQKDLAPLFANLNFICLSAELFAARINDLSKKRESND